MGRPGDMVVVGLSGGADSTCLLESLDILKGEFGVRLAAAHFEHGIRGKAGRRDAEFARSLAGERNLRFILGRGDVPALAQREKLSIEEAARKARYEFFDSIPRRFRGVKKEAIKIALGHTADDQAETVIMRLLRGSGPRGLGGIPPVRGRFIRPLIEVSRETIIGFLRARNLSWTEDETNVSGDYLRNRIRRELMPALKEYNPNLVATLVRTAQACREMSDLLDGEAAGMLAKCRIGKREVFIPRKLLKDEHPARAMALIEAAINEVKGSLWAVRSDHRRAILEAARTSGTAQIILPGGFEANIGKDVRVGGPHSPIEDFRMPLEVPGTTRIEALGVTFDATIVKPAKNYEMYPPNVAHFDLDSMKRPIEIRNFRRGDRFQPIGMKGTRKAQDIFIDLKVPREWRRRVPIITAGGDIAWVAPFRMAHGFRVTGKTHQVLRIVLNEAPDFAANSEVDEK